MLFDPYASIAEQKLQKDRLLKSFNNIAEQAITDSPVHRDALQEQLIQFIYKQPFDSLYGGLVIQSQNGHEYFKPKETNKILRDIFTQADQVFYHGLFSYTARQIDDCLITIENEKHLLEELSASFTFNELNSRLDQKEIQLLMALVPKSKFQSNEENLFISYVCSLKNAALMIDMHYKEAQFIEFSIQNKLKELR